MIVLVPLKLYSGFPLHIKTPPCQDQSESLLQMVYIRFDFVNAFRSTLRNYPIAYFCHPNPLVRKIVVHLNGEFSK